MLDLVLGSDDNPSMIKETTMTVKRINLADLTSHLEIAATHRANFVAIETLTAARVRKTGNPHPNVLKRSKVQAVIGHNYAQSVNHQRVREGSTPDFQALPRKWGQRIAGTPFVTHNGKLYLECGVLKVLGASTFELPNGEPIDSDKVTPFLPTTYSNAEHQGVDREVILRDYALESIQRITIDGETLEVVSH
jgi:hypothetical protein